MTSRRELIDAFGVAFHSNGDQIFDLLSADVTPKQVAGTTYTLGEDDAGCYIEFTSGSPVTVTVPPNNAAHFHLGVVITFEQGGAGQVTIAAGAGVTIRSSGNLVASAAQYAVLSLIKRGTNAWTLCGERA